MPIPNGYNGIPNYQYLEAIAAGIGSIGTDYFVDVNAGADTNDGLSWEYPLKTLAAAIVLSNAAIAAGAFGWANRNRIFFKGDNDEDHKETLTTLPNKCDVIGVGSYDHRPYPTMIGNHVIGAATYMGTRFINMGFKSLAAGGAIFTVPDTTVGLQFLGCVFDGNTAVAATIGLSATGVDFLRVENCSFIGAFSTTAINLGAGEGRGTMILNNWIEGVKGFTVNSSFTTATERSVFAGNMMETSGMIVDENSDKFLLANNTWLCGAGNGYAACLDIEIVRCVGNVLTTANGTTYDVPPKAGALA
jgi:hypothetical protein